MVNKVKRFNIDSLIGEHFLKKYAFLTDYIQYWLGSIHTYGSESAPVILVASHSKDEETGGEVR